MKKFLKMMVLIVLLASSVFVNGTAVSASSGEVTFYIVRHGKTMLNTTDRVQGWADAPLTPAGADVVAQAGYGLKDIEFARAISSDSGRAMETADLILAENAKNAPTLETDWKLREFNFGTYEGDLNHTMWTDLATAEGKTLDEWMLTMTPENFANGVAALDKDIMDQTPNVSNWPAEDYTTIKARLKASIDTVAEQQSQLGGGNVLLVSHGLSIGALLKEIDPNAQLPVGGLKNASVTKVTYKDGQYTIEDINDLSYIQAGNAAGITANQKTVGPEVTPIISENEVVFYLMRHGKTMLNTTDRVQGWSDAPLTPAGAEVVDFAAAGLRGINFNYAYSSDSGRAIQTAELVLAGNRNATPKLVKDWKLREFNFGTYEGDLNHTMWTDLATAEGKTLDEWMLTMTPKSFADGVSALDAEIMAGQPGVSNWPAEDYTTIQNRLVTSLNTIGNDVAQKGGGNVLLVSHGLSISALLAEIAPDVQLPAGGLKNASISKVIFKDGIYTVETLNDLNFIEEGKKMQEKFALNFDLNGGTSVKPNEELVNYASLGTKVTDPTREGFTFSSWNTAADGTGVTWNFEETTMPYNAVTLYAQWGKEAETTTTENTDTTTATNGAGTLPETGESNALMFIALGLLFVGGSVLLITSKKYGVR